MPDYDAVVVGGGQAGLAVSHELTGMGVGHVVLERHRIGETWRRRWDSFCLVTPNWTMDLPGFPYDGDDPQGFVPRDEIVAYLERYAASFQAPVRCGVEVQGLEATGGAGFRLRTSAGDVQARRVVLATGAYQRPHRPPVAATFPSRMLVIDAEDYTPRAPCRPARCSWSGAARPAASSPKTSTPRAARSCSPAAALRGAPGASGVSTWSTGSRGRRGSSSR